ncbi:MAG: glycosyltransferase [Bacteroidetes bacterium]|nr:glycosyltransferase [Bacteroidota bacterium]
MIIAEAPIISIVTVAYNSQRFIHQTIKSVLSQSYTNFEYIIIDDCSTDETWNIIQQYKDERIIAIRNDKNLTEYKNRNKAISLAKGEYIVFVDGDDIALNRGIELAVTEIELYKNCGFAIVKTENPKFIGPLEINSKDGYNLEYFGGGFLNSSLANNIFKTSFLKEIFFDESYANADTYLRLRLLKKTNVLVLTNPICLWRLTNNQASKKISYNNQLQQNIVFIKSNIFEDESFNYFEKERLKPFYYKLIYRLFKQESLRGNIQKAFAVKKYFMDNLGKALKYLFQKSGTNFWSEYNYSNLNINIKQ